MLNPSQLENIIKNIMQNTQSINGGAALNTEQQNTVNYISSQLANGIYEWILTAEVTTLVTVGGVTSGAATSLPTSNVGTIS